MSKKNKPRIVNNLEEFMKVQGFEATARDCYSWARGFYKYTPCGPWTSFLISGEEASKRFMRFCVGKKDDKLCLLVAEEQVDPKDVITKEDYPIFGFLPDGTVEKDVATSIKGYREQAEDFAKSFKKGNSDLESFKVHEGHPETGELSNRYVWIDAVKSVEAGTKELYYEDLNKVGGESTDMSKCIGVEFGSIVEGSEANSGPFVHEFPFDMNDFDRDVEYMEKETSFYWERDNSTWLTIRRIEVSKQCFYLHNAWGDIKWDGEVPKNTQLRNAAEAFARDEAILNAENDVWLPIPGAGGWEMSSWQNDGTF
jgi:hypothetical protein